jgi:hypothetical protein
MFFMSATLLLAQSVHAQDSRRDEATRLMSEGVKLAEQHDEAGALAKFEAAYRAYPTPNALYNVARERQLLGKNLEAVKDFRDCRKSPLLDPKLATMADQFIAELEKTTARIAVQAPAGSVVAVDGATVDATAPIDVTPGAHTVTASALGQTSTKQIDAPVGQTTGVTLTIESKSSVEPPKTEEHTKAFPPPTGAIILGGVGIVGLGLGVGFALDASSKNSDYQNLNCANVGGADCENRRSSIGTLSTVSVVSYVAGGALLAGGIVWWIVAPRKNTTSVSMAPMTAPGLGGLQLHGTF